MRQVYLVPRRINSVGNYEIKEGSGVRQPAPDRVRNPLSYGIQQQYEALRQPAGDNGKVYQRSLTKKERRKLSRRIMRKRVLLELRSGIGRRRSNQRESDFVEHIDEKV